VCRAGRVTCRVIAFSRQSLQCSPLLLLLLLIAAVNRSMHVERGRISTSLTATFSLNVLTSLPACLHGGPGGRNNSAQYRIYTLFRLEGMQPAQDEDKYTNTTQVHQ